MKRLGLLIVLIFILLSGWVFSKITYQFSLHSYWVTSSFWRLGSRYSYTISTCDGKSIKLRSRTQEEEDKLFFDEIILPKDVSDTIYLSMDELVVENNGFIVEKFVAPHLEADARNSRILKINYGTHYEKIFYIERITRDNADYFVYDQVKDKYVRFTVGGGNLVVWLNHGMKSRPVVPVKGIVKVWGIIPIQMNLERIIRTRNYSATYVE